MADLEIAASESAITAPSTPAHPSKRFKRASSQSELNVEEVILGDRSVKPSFGSLYREELLGSESVKRLFVCEGCFKYTRDVVAYMGHRRFCDYRRELPGEVVYEKDRYSMLEVDGEDYHLFTQNLSLFAKLFIDTKSVCFDASTFLFYLLIDNTPSATSSTPLPTHDDNPQIIGFFSKEKLSWDNNNLACILVFPPWQKMGLGQMLMGASYELSKRDGRLGGPERPLSAAGLASYTIYWCRIIGRLLLTHSQNKPVTVREISKATYMIPDDVVGTLQAMGVGVGEGASKSKRKDGSLTVDKMVLRKWLAARGIDWQKEVVAQDGFVEDLRSGSEQEDEEEEQDGDEG